MVENMTSRERLLAAMHFEEVDRVPVGPFGLGRLDPDSDIAAELIAKTDPFIEIGAGGDPFLGSSAEVSRHEDGDSAVIVYSTPKGDLVQRWKRTSITSATMEFAIKTPEDAEKFLSIPYTPPKFNLEPFRAWKERVGEEALVMTGMADGICLPAQWLSPEDFCIWWIDHRDLMTELTRVGHERVKQYVEALCREGVDAFRVVGGEYASVQLGPEGFDQLVVEFDRELVDLIHSYGGVVYYHNHGPVMRYLEKFADIGMDALDPLEAPPFGDADLKEARRRLGNRVSFVGNLDDMEVINALPAEEVKKIARERLEAAGKRGFILGGTTSGTYGEHAARNFIEMVEVAREYRG